MPPIIRENLPLRNRIPSESQVPCIQFQLPAAVKADLLLAPHGRFWNPAHPWTAKRYELLRLLLEHALAVDTSHLRRDAHPILGNNARLRAALGLK